MIEKCLISDYLKIQVFIKIGFMLQASHLIICDPKSKLFEHYYWEQTEYVYCHSFEFLHNLLISFIQNCWTEAESYSEPYQIFKMTFLTKIINISRGIFTIESNIEDGAFGEKKFQLSTISVVHYLHKKIHHRYLTPFWICIWSC